MCLSIFFAMIISSRQKSSGAGGKKSPEDLVKDSDSSEVYPKSKASENKGQKPDSKKGEKRGTNVLEENDSAISVVVSIEQEVELERENEDKEE